MHADFGEIERSLVAFEHDIAAALKHCHHADTTPASITLTVQ